MPKAGKGGKNFYAVAHGELPGVYTTWSDAEQQVKGFKGAVYKKFSTEQHAKSWISLVQAGGDPAVAAAQVTAGSSHNPSPTNSKAAPAASSSSSSSAAQKNSAASASTGPGSSTSSFTRQVYCDGACPGNGKGGAIAGSGVFWGEAQRDIAERLPGPAQTNQRAELYAILRVLESDEKPEQPLEILTDSAYSISCLSVWHYKWADNGWKNASGNAVVNADLIQRILYLARRRPASGKLKFTHVRGHQGIEGNERADRLAVQGSKLPQKQERDYAGDTEEDELWAQVGDLPLDADMLQFDISAKEVERAQEE